jgi:hypothetical protein
VRSAASRRWFERSIERNALVRVLRRIAPAARALMPGVESVFRRLPGTGCRSVVICALGLDGPGRRKAVAPDAIAHLFPAPGIDFSPVVLAYVADTAERDCLVINVLDSTG